uniref:Ice-structuring protein n=1 Tax=Cyprinus carpio TaxID=7962 RepID=A0A8C1VR93_CYPCA
PKHPVLTFLLFYLHIYPLLGKSVVAKTAIPKGTELILDMLTVKVAEPKGIAPEDIFQLVGKKVTIDIEEDESITEDAVDNYGKKAKA